jgi:CBS domain-containing protein
MQAKDIMTSPVITVGPDTSVTEIATLLLERRISGVPVVDRDGTVLGIVSEGDLLRRVEMKTERRRSRWLEMLTDQGDRAADFVKSHGTLARDIMSREMITVEPSTDLAEIAELMERHRIKRVPVVADGALVGIISRANLLHGLVAYKRSPAGTAAVSDPEIRAGLNDLLRRESWADLNRINVVVSDGVVHLWGVVDSEEQRHALTVAARSVPGVKSV